MGIHALELYFDVHSDMYIQCVLWHASCMETCMYVNSKYRLILQPLFMFMLGVDMVDRVIFYLMTSVQHIHSLRSPYYCIFGPVCQRQFALVLGPGKQYIL